MGVKKQLLAFAIALGVLILAISAWVVFRELREQEVPVELVVETDLPTKTPRKKNSEERLEAGEKFLAADEFEKAAAEFAAAATSNPSAIEPLLLLAETQIRLREFEKARANLAAAKQLDATHPDIFILEGITFIREENFLEAEKSFAKTDEAGAFWQGAMAAFFDRTEESEKLLAEAGDARTAEILDAYAEYESFPDSPKTHLDTLLTRAFVKIKEYELALAKIGPVLEDDPDYRDAWLLTGYAQFAQRKFELAKQSWQAAFALDSAKPETQYFLGLANFELGEFAEAEKFFLLARENRMQATDLAEKLAETYFQQGKYRAAADLLAEQLAENPEAALESFITPISLYLEKVGDGRNAWNLANLAQQRFPEEAFAHNLAGWVSLANGYLPEAKNYLEASIRLNPQLPWPYFNLGRYFEKTENRASALAAYHEAWKLDESGAVGTLAAQNYNRLLDEINPPETKSNLTENE